MKTALLLLIAVLALSGCQSAPEWARVQAERAKVDFPSRIRSSVSMHGFEAGDHLRVVVADYSKIKAGDPVYFWAYNKPCPTFHLAKYKTTKGWVTQGTANKYADAELLTPMTYIGRWEALK